MWLLGRQWQLGELDGEDAGSPMAVEVYGSWSPVERVLLGAGPVRGGRRASDFDAAATPLEAVVAHEPAPDRDHLLAFALETAARVAQELAARNAAAALAWLVATYPLDEGDMQVALDTCGPAERRRVELLRERLFDGRALLAAAHADFAAATSGLPTAGQTAVRVVVDAIGAEVDLAALAIPVAGAARPAAWDGARLGSSFAIGATSDTGEVVLRADDWDGEELDWWAFDRTAEAALGATTQPAPLTAPGGAPLVRLPGRLGFRGAPAVRYWEFEDAAVDLVAAKRRRPRSGAHGSTPVRVRVQRRLGERADRDTGLCAAERVQRRRARQLRTTYPGP